MKKFKSFFFVMKATRLNKLLQFQVLVAIGIKIKRKFTW